MAQQPTLGMLAGSPVPITVGGRLLRMSPPTLGEIGEYRNWVAQEPFRRITGALESMPVAMQNRVIDNACKESREIGREENIAAACENAMKSPQGVAYMWWIMLRGNHPELSLADVEALVNEENAALIRKQIEKVALTDPTIGPTSTPAAGLENSSGGSPSSVAPAI